MSLEIYADDLGLSLSTDRSYRFAAVGRLLQGLRPGDEHRNGHRGGDTTTHTATDLTKIKRHEHDEHCERHDHW